MNARICLLLLVSSLMISSLPGGCQPPASPTEVSGKTVTDPHPAESRLALEPCEAGGGRFKAECGSLRVPEDRSKPGGRMLDLAVVVVRAYGSDPAPDPFFYIAGGPGLAATDANVVSSAHSIFVKINARHDIVFLDQRGTNGNHLLACEPITFDPASAPQQKVDDWMQQCLAGLNGDPRFYTTVVAMHDLDAAREALGYDKINLFGMSYGAAAVQVYMRMFPEHYRAGVIDHGTALDLPFFPALPRASQSALDQVFKYCEQDEKCHAAYPDIRGDWRKLLDRLDEGPVVTSFLPPGAAEPAQVDRYMIDDGIHSLMYQSGTYAMIPSLIHALASQEDWTSIVKKYNAQFSDQPGSFLLMKHMIFCFEPAWGADAEAVARLNPDSYYTGLEVEIAKDQQKFCAALPKPDPALIYGPGKPAPLSALILNSLIDPQNPPSNMDLALKEFTRSRVVVEPTEGHDTSASRCRWDIIAQYIEQGSVEGLDTACMEQQKPSFAIIQW